MFTGIIEELGIVKSLEKKGTIWRLQIFAPQIGPTIHSGQSTCVNGVCLTCVTKEKDLLSFEIMSETMRRTNLGTLKYAEKVNLERALKVDGRIDGHFVTGHIDGTGIISKRQRKDGDIIISVKSLPQILRYIVLKGSVALDGVSLAVSLQDNASFVVNLIPHTLKNTTLGLKKEREVVNIECDLLAKYIDKFLFDANKPSSPANINISFLKEHGFI